MLEHFLNSSFIMDSTIKKNSADKFEDEYIQFDSGKVFEDYAKSLAQEGKFGEALSIYSMVTKQSGPNKDLLSDISQQLMDYYSKQNRHRRSVLATDPWSCCACAGIIIEPVTLPCGHSVCKKCLIKDFSETCKKCGSKHQAVEPDPVNDTENIKTSILVADLVNKYWGKEIRAVELRNEGNKLFGRGDAKTSIQKYSDAFTLAPNDHLLTSNRSHAYMKLGMYEESLEDAQRTIKTRPDWGKGHFRRGMVLQAQGKFDEATVAFFMCLALEDQRAGGKPLKAEICKVLSRLVMQDSTTTSAAEEQAEENNKSHTGVLTGDEAKNRILISKNPKFFSVAREIEMGVKHASKLNFKPEDRDINPSSVDKDDFDCALCYRLLWQPVTTNCGHTYCRSCLDRSLDHRRECPLCKTELKTAASSLGVNEFLDKSIRRLLPSDFLDRQRVFEEEISDNTSSVRTDGRTEIPVFVCTMSFPSIPCPLHVFEPRYRLMIRRAMENGTREFGMCTNDPTKGFVDYGTMLEIRDIQYFADGRSVVDTMGSRRFRVLERGTKDGYNTAVVEFLDDDIPSGDLLQETKNLHDTTLGLAVAWFQDMDPSVKVNITSHYGAMPRVEFEYWANPSGPAWAWWVLAILPLDPTAQQHILSQTSLKKRLEAIGRILGYMKRRRGSAPTGST